MNIFFNADQRLTKKFLVNYIFSQKILVTSSSYLFLIYFMFNLEEVLNENIT